MLFVEYPRLYGVTSTGAFKVWSIAVEQPAKASKSAAVITVVHGLEGGKQQTTKKVIREGKNLGKSNETTPFEQASAEAQSVWKKKLDKGYTKSKSVASKNENAGTTRLPMLAHKFTERKHDIVWPAYVQPKLNGARCLIERRGDDILFHSRGNKQFLTLKHLVPDCLAVLKDGEFLDGELYAHGDITFQQIMSLIKNVKRPDYAMLAKHVRFHNYDRPSDLGFKDRQKTLVNRGMILKVPTFKVQNEADVRAKHTEFCVQGYEGTMVRSGGDEPYRFKYRSTTLLKLKDFEDDEFEIVGVKEGQGKAEGTAIFKCKVPSGATFDVRCKGTDEDRQEQWENRADYIGKMLTVKFQNYSDDGIPIFPVGIAVRDYE